MADAKATFAIFLEDSLSPGAAKAKASVNALSASLKDAKSKLAGYQSQLSLAKGLGDVEGYRKYSALVDQGKRSIFDLTSKAEAAGPALSSGTAAAGSMAGAIGLVAVAAATAVAAIAGVITVTNSLVMKSLEVVNANQLMVAQFDAVGAAGEGSGKKVLGMLDGLAEKLPQGRDQLGEWTKKIQEMGVTDLGKIRQELVATASAQAIGNAEAAAYEKIQAKVARAEAAGGKLKLSDKFGAALLQGGVKADVAQQMGMSVKDLSAGLKAGTVDAKKFGEALSSVVTARGKGPLDVMMNSLESLSRKAKEAFGHFFDGIETGPITDALRNVIALGNQGQPSGEALKMGFVPAMNAIIKLIGSAITEAALFFMDIEIGALKTYIALKPLINGVGQIVDGMKAIGGAVSGAIGGAADSAGLGDISAKEGADFGTQFLSSLGGPTTAIIELIRQTLLSTGDEKAQEIARAGGEASGRAMIEGIRAGVDAHSPSRAARMIGADIGEGLGGGVEDSPAPARAARTISSNALGGLAGGKSPFGGGGANDNGGGAASIGQISINITAPDGVTDAHQLSMIGLSAALERYQIGSGR